MTHPQIAQVLKFSAINNNSLQWRASLFTRFKANVLAHFLLCSCGEFGLATRHVTTTSSASRCRPGGNAG